MGCRLNQRFRRVLVTGGRSGLGRALVEAFRLSGLEVYGTSRNPEADESWLLRAELGSAAGRERFLEEYAEVLQNVDLWVFNAGSAALGCFPQQDENAIAEQLQLMMEGPIHLARFAWPRLQGRSDAALVFVSSLAAVLPMPGMSVYNSAKAGLSHFASSLMLERSSVDPQVIDWQLGDLRTGFNQHFIGQDNGDPRIIKLRARLDALLDSAPAPECAVGDLLKALQSGRSQRIYGGSFFQTRLAMLGYRFFPQRWMHQLIRSYYRFP